MPLQGPPDRGTQRTAHRPTAAPGHSQRLGACCRAPGLADEHLLCLASRVRRGGWSSPWCVAFCSGPLQVGGSAVGGVPFRSGKRVHALCRCRRRTSTTRLLSPGAGLAPRYTGGCGCSPSRQPRASFPSTGRRHAATNPPNASTRRAHGS